MQPSTSGTRGKDHWSKAATLIKKEIQDLHLDPFRLLKCDPTTFVNLGDNDVVIASYPRSGGNLVSHVLYNIVMKIKLKYGLVDMACDIKVFEETSEDLMEIESTGEEEDQKKIDGRIFTSKLRYNYIAKHASKSKVIYVVRNPKHAAVELFNTFYIKHLSFREFLDIFLGFEAEDTKNPYNYKAHFMQYLENEFDLDIMFFKYEDLEQKPDEAIRNILDHLGLHQVTMTTEEAKEIVEVQDENMLTSWNVLSRSIKTNEFAAFFEPELVQKFEKELKIDWKLVKTGTV